MHTFDSCIFIYFLKDMHITIQLDYLNVKENDVIFANLELLNQSITHCSIYS